MKCGLSLMGCNIGLDGSGGLIPPKDAESMFRKIMSSSCGLLGGESVEPLEPVERGFKFGAGPTIGIGGDLSGSLAEEMEKKIILVLNKSYLSSFACYCRMLQSVIFYCVTISLFTFVIFP